MKKMKSKSQFEKKEVTVIKAGKRILLIDFHELKKWREPLYLLAKKNITVRYKQTLLGYGWAILQPLLTMLVFLFVFGKVAKISTDEISYPLFVLSGVILWALYSRCILSISSVVVSHSQLIEKVYFPRIILPMSVVLASLFDFVITLPLFVVVFFLYKNGLSGKIFFFPLFVIYSLVSAFGIGLLFSAANVFYRDVGLTIPFFVQLFMFMSPVAYPVTEIPDHFYFIFYLNPFVSAVEGFRWTLFANYELIDVSFILINSFVSLLLLAVGLSVFRYTERLFVDRI